MSSTVSSETKVSSEKHGKSKTPEAHYELPSVETLKEAGDLKIKDEYGKEIQFSSLYQGKSGQQLIVFIRHFFCGVCPEPRASALAVRQANMLNSRTAKTTCEP